MHAFFSWFESITYINIICYWVFILALDFIFMNNFIVRKEYEPHSISLNLWLPFGVVIPCVWILNIQTPTVIDLIVAILMFVFYILIRPHLYRRGLSNKYT